MYIELIIRYFLFSIKLYFVIIIKWVWFDILKLKIKILKLKIKIDFSKLNLIYHKYQIINKILYEFQNYLNKNQNLFKLYDLS